MNEVRTALADLLDAFIKVAGLEYEHSTVASNARCVIDELEIEVTPEMIAAGVRAADLITYQWGETPEVTLVSRVYRAMDAARAVR